MAEFVLFVVVGLSAGAVYAIAGVGLVLTYKTTGIFNFAHGAIATVSAYVFWVLHVNRGMGWPMATAVAVLAVGVGFGFALELLGRALGHVTLAWRVAATVGLLLAINAVIDLIFDPVVVRQVPAFLGSKQVSLGSGITMQVSDIVTVLIGLAVTAGVSAMLRFSQTGISLRAVVDNRELLATAGTNPNAVRRIAWVVGSTLAAASGVLFAPLLPLNSVQLTLIIVAAFGAAAVGGFRSLWLTYLGGMLIGVGSSLATRYLTGGLLAGVSTSLPFLVLFGVLLVFPRSKMVRPPVAVVRPLQRWTPPPRSLVTGGLVLLGFLALVPTFAGIHLTDWTVALGTSIILMSLGLLVSTSGQVSLGHVGFAAIGACAMSHLVVDRGVPWFVGLVLAGVIAIPIGALLAVPAIRLSGLYLALATFGFGILLQYMFYTQDYMFGATGAGLVQSRPAGFEGDRVYFYLTLLLAAVVFGSILLVHRSRLGRLLGGLADAPTTLQTAGTSANVTRVLVFCLSAFLAAIGGALIGGAQLSSAADSYPPLLSLTYLTVVVLVGLREPWNGVMAAGALVLVPSYLGGADVPVVMQLVFGISVLLAALTPEHRRHLPLKPRVTQSKPGVIAEPEVTPTPRVDQDASLEVRGATVRFGGLVAVDSLDLTVRAGQIVGLIGPNGAGKTTTFNACSGTVNMSGGRVILNGRDVTRLSPGSRARHGLGRTFQHMELFDTQSVRRNVELGAEAPSAGPNPFSHLIAGPSSRRRQRALVNEALTLCGLVDLADMPVGQLSTGQRRLVDLARCLAGDYDIYLLDEPSSGLDPTETARFGAILRDVVERRGIGILLVEHDLSLVLGVCGDILVLDFGRSLFHGTPDEVTSSPIVRAAYLGDAIAEIASEAVAG